jgi:flagellar basal-body rod protein FlgF
MNDLSQTNSARQTMLRNMMDVIANNIANMSTPGFKSENLLFKEYVNKNQDEGDKGVQAKNSSGYRDLSQGILSPTFNKFDLALQGEGYFGVQTPDGVKYTRAGAFSLNNKKEIVTKSGYPVLSDGDTPLVVQPGASAITVAENGTVSSEKGNIGKLKLVKFENPQSVVPAGDNLFDADSAGELPAEDLKVAQGMLENSNVQPVFEMNKMIEIIRMYQSTQNIVTTDHEMIRGMIQKLTKV